MNKLKYILALAIIFFIGQVSYAQMQGGQGQGGYGGYGGGGNGQGGQGSGRHRSASGTDEEGSPKYEKPEPEELAKMQTAKMQKDLNLTPEQNKKVGDINLKYAKEIEEQRKSTPEMTDYTKAVMMKIRNNQNEELKSVLTEEQWQAFQKKKEDAKRQRMYGGQ